MDEKDLERILVKGIIGAGLIAALVAALAMPMTARAAVVVMMTMVG